MGSTGRTGRLGARGRVIAAIGAATLLAGLAVWGVVPAGAEDDSQPDSSAAETVPEVTPAETTPPETTPPETTPPETTPPETTPPGTTPPKGPPAENRPSLPQEQGVGSLDEVAILATATIEYTGQGTTDGACNTFVDPATSPVSFDPATQFVWQFNLTGLVNPQPPGFPQLTYVFTNGPSASQVTPPNSFTGSIAKWYVVTPKDATLNNFPSTFAEAEPGQGDPQLTISHCWGEDNVETGSLEVVKALDGDGSPAPAAEFTIEVDCEGDDFDETLVFDAGGVLVSGTNPITDIPLGTECTVDETGDGDADEVSYDPAPPTVTINSAGQAVTVTVTNTFDEAETGSLEVEKVTEGDVQPGVEFQIDVDCDGLEPVVLTFTAPGDLGPKSVDDLPIGTECTVQESADGGATLVVYNPNGGTEQEPPTVTVGAIVQLVTVTNFFPSTDATGSVVVTKAVEGTPPAGATYEVRVFCTDGTDETLQFGANGGIQTVTAIKIPASCTVEETGQGGASSVTYSPQGTTFGLTIESPERDLSVTNVFDPQTVTVGGASAVRSDRGSVVQTATGTLPFTGSMIAGLLKAAAWFLGLGLACLLVAYRWPARSRRTA